MAGWNDLCQPPGPANTPTMETTSQITTTFEEDDKEKLRKWVLQTIFGDSTSRSVSSILKKRLITREYSNPLRIYVGLIETDSEEEGGGGVGGGGVSRGRFEFWFEGEDCRISVSSLPFSQARCLPPCPPFVDGGKEVPFDISFASLQKKAGPLDILSPKDLEKETIEGMNTDLSHLLPLTLKCCAEWIGYCCSSLVWKISQFPSSFFFFFPSSPLFLYTLPYLVVLGRIENKCDGSTLSL